MDYARTLVEHPKWTWHIGMVAERGARVYDIGKGFAGYEVPDINHPATKGWLLHMLREATGIMDAGAMSDGETWNAGDEDPARATFVHEFDDPPRWVGYATEGEALAAALLAVWGDA